MREDVRAAQQSQRAQEANAKLAIERTKPSLDLYAILSVNGLEDQGSHALAQPFSDGRPTQTVGVRFSVPIDFRMLKDTAQGYVKESEAAALQYQEKQYAQTHAWMDLRKRIEDAKKRLALFETLVHAQEDKLVLERKRLRQGRTTTYQVLLFEQDHIFAQLGWLHAAYDLLELRAQTSLYRDGL
jgi:outer membrane protein TolC